MRPIGLTIKNARLSAYTGRTSGEIMLVHRCEYCGSISCNRIAGDDDGYAVLNLLRESANMPQSTLNELNDLDIQLLTMDDEQMVSIGLFGINYQELIG
jgi:hypothetical protein